MRLPKAISRSRTKARSPTSIRGKNMKGWSAVGRATAAPAIRRDRPGDLDAGEFLRLVARVAPHLRSTIAFGDEPGGHGRRDLAHAAWQHTVEADAVHLSLERFSGDSDSHWPTAHVGDAPAILIQAFRQQTAD